MTGVPVSTKAGIDPHCRPVDIRARRANPLVCSALPGRWRINRAGRVRTIVGPVPARSQPTRSKQGALSCKRSSSVPADSIP
jgi:hypothetical protein